MITKEYIEENKTKTFKKGDEVIMINCGEADHYKGRVWKCRTDSYMDRCGDDLVFLEGFGGCFLTKFLTPPTTTTNKEK